MLSQVHAPTHMQKHLELWKTACANQTSDYTFLLQNCPCLIKICANSHIPIEQDAVVDYEIEVTLSILILKAIDSHKNQKGFLHSTSI